MPKVLTQSGFKSYYGIRAVENNDDKYKLTLNGCTLICTPDHRLMLEDSSFIFARELKTGDTLANDVVVENIETISSHEYVYDLLNVQDTESYITENAISHNCLYLDEFAFVPNNLQEDFFNSVYPTISSGKTTKVIITSTPNGMNMFYKIWKDAEDGKNSYATHYVQWNDVPGRDDEWRAETIRNTSERQFQQEYCCDFLGSSNTLIDARKIGQLTYSSPLHEANGVEIFHHPEPNRSYLMTVDTSRGAGIDYSAFIVFDITEIPYKMVAKFRSDEIPVLVYPNVIHQVGTYYNDSLVLVEINDIGQQVADILHFDLEYEGVIFTQTKGKAGQKIGQGFGKTKPQLGVRTTTSVKRIGCSNFKNLVESDKLILCDVDLIFELSRFIAVKNSYEAEEGYHDDLVMCCVLFAWMVNQPYFKELTDTDVRYRLSQDQSELIDAHLSPFIIDDGNDFEEESNDFYSLNW